MAKIDLLSISTNAPKGADKKDIKKETQKLAERLGELQNTMFAEGKHSLLVVLQGMDASGKGGAVRKGFGEVNPNGIRVKAFKAPSKKELAHDYLWRVHQNTPAKGMIQIFDRSHYEEVLITRVEGWVDDETAHKRFRHLNDFERLLTDCGTHILKFYLHVSEAEQRERFYERLTDPRKNWKYSIDDLNKAKKWPAYRKAYEDVIEHCGPEIPWHIVPTDNNWWKEYYIAKTVVEKLESLNMQYPKGEVDVNHPEAQQLIAAVGKD